MGSRFSTSVSPSVSPRSSNRPPSPVLDIASDVSFYYRSKMFWSYFDEWISSKEGTYLLAAFGNESIREKLYHTRSKKEVYSIFYHLHSVLTNIIRDSHRSNASRHPLLYWKQHHTDQFWPEYNTANSNYRLFDSAGTFYQVCNDLLRYIPGDLRKDKACHREAVDESIYYSKLSRCCYTISDQYSNCSVVIEKLNQPRYQSIGEQIQTYSLDTLLQQESSLLTILSS